MAALGLLVATVPTESKSYRQCITRPLRRAAGWGHCDAPPGGLRNNIYRYLQKEKSTCDCRVALEMLRKYYVALEVYDLGTPLFALPGVR